MVESILHQSTTERPEVLSCRRLKMYAKEDVKGCTGPGSAHPPEKQMHCSAPGAGIRERREMLNLHFLESYTFPFPVKHHFAVHKR